MIGEVIYEKKMDESLPESFGYDIIQLLPLSCDNNRCNKLSVLDL